MNSQIYTYGVQQNYDKFVRLLFDPKTGKYLANPTVEKESDMALSRHDYVLWHDEFSKLNPLVFSVVRKH